MTEIGGDSMSDLEPFAAEIGEPWLPANLRTPLDPKTAANPETVVRIEGQRRRGADGQWLVHGELRAYDRRGTLRFVAHYRDNISDGVGEWFYPSGQLHKRGHYLNANPHGVFEEWYESGVLKSRNQWRHRQLVGTWEDFHENGRLRRQAQYDDQGRRTGVTIGWSDDGRELYRTVHADGRETHTIEFAEDGSIRSVVMTINEGTLVVQRPGTPKQRVFMVGHEDDFERMIPLPPIEAST